MVLFLSVLVGLLATGTPADLNVVRVPESAQLVTYDAPASQQLFALVNQARADAGLPVLTWDERLSEAARRHTQSMAQRQELSHGLPGEPGFSERLAEFRMAVQSAGENVARAASSEVAHSGFMRSPGHRANVLNRDYTRLGIGVVRSGSVLYFTEDFASPAPEIRSLQAEHGGESSPQTTDDEAAETVANRVADLLQKSGTALTRRNDARLQILAQTMAQQDRLTGSAGLSLPGARYAVAYTVSDPGQLPTQLNRLSSLSHADQYAVGATFARTARHPRGTYWVLLVLFSADSTPSTGGMSRQETAFAN